jgi:Tfp pilus assembly protein FimV
MDDRSPARFLAPAAIVASFIALIIVLSSSGGGEERSDQERSRPARARTTATAPARRPPRPRRFYTVKAGDILSTIAEQTGVPAQQIEDLNPNVDPQGLIPGQRLRLRP